MNLYISTWILSIFDNKFQKFTHWHMNQSYNVGVIDCSCSPNTTKKSLRDSRQIDFVQGRGTLESAICKLVRMLRVVQGIFLMRNQIILSTEKNISWSVTWMFRLTCEEPQLKPDICDFNLAEKMGIPFRGVATGGEWGGSGPPPLLFWTKCMCGHYIIFLYTGYPGTGH